MTMRTILAPIPDTAVNVAAIETALMVAKAVAGHVEALFIASPPPAVPVGGYAGYETASYDRAAAAARQAEEQLARDAAEIGRAHV